MRDVYTLYFLQLGPVFCKPLYNVDGSMNWIKRENLLATASLHREALIDEFDQAIAPYEAMAEEQRQIALDELYA